MFVYHDFFLFTVFLVVAAAAAASVTAVEVEAFAVCYILFYAVEVASNIDVTSEVVFTFDFTSRACVFHFSIKKHKNCLCTVVVKILSLKATICNDTDGKHDTGH